MREYRIGIRGQSGKLSHSQGSRDIVGGVGEEVSERAFTDLETSALNKDT